MAVHGNLHAGCLLENVVANAVKKLSNNQIIVKRPWSWSLTMGIQCKLYLGVNRIVR